MQLNAFTDGHIAQQIDRQIGRIVAKEYFVVILIFRDITDQLVTDIKSE